MTIARFSSVQLHVISLLPGASLAIEIDAVRARPPGHSRRKFTPVGLEHCWLRHCWLHSLMLYTRDCFFARAAQLSEAGSPRPRLKVARSAWEYARSAWEYARSA